MSGVVMLIVARLRRRPGRWLLPALGLALAAAFAGAVGAEATIAGDRAAQSVLTRLSPLERSVRVSWQGPVTPAIRSQAVGLLHGLGLPAPAEVLLLGPVRLDGELVRPAAITPLADWITGGTVGRCRAVDCPMLVAGGAVHASPLTTAGVRIPVLARTRLRSTAPLGFIPAAASPEPPPLLTGDVAGLDALAGLSGLYRSHSWLSLLATDTLRSWQLTGVEQRLQRAQAALVAGSSQFRLDAPFTGLDAARAQASAAPRRLLLAGGGAVAALLAFLVLAAGGLRRDQDAELERLRAAGAGGGQRLAFVAGEAAWLCALALLAGAGLAIAATALMASAAGLPVGGVLTHSLLTPTGALALAGGWLGATALLSLVLLAPTARVADVLAFAALAALALALLQGTDGSGSLAVLLAPLCSLAAGVVVFRGASALLRAGEQLMRGGPVLARLAFVGLARAPAVPALAIACIAVSVGLGAFALAYRATLLRGSADQAANQVPLDAVITPSAGFTTPLQLAPLGRWRALADGAVLPVRRTEATFASGATSVTVPALGVPASGLALIHGWRASDGSAPLTRLARSLTPPGPARAPGPPLPPGTRWLSIRLASSSLAATAVADLRDSSGVITQLTLGTAGPRASTDMARVPRGSWELAGIELDEPAGLVATNGHQNAENPGAATQSTATIALGPLRAVDAGGRTVVSVSLGRWRGVGAAVVAPARPGPVGATLIRFSETGQPGLVRPAQPSDTRPVPVLVDPTTSAAAARNGRLALTIAERPVLARVVGVLARFPTIGADAGGFVVADTATLASALDAQLPGQGRADELWISSRDPARLRSALRSDPLSQLGAAFRADVERQLGSAPIARAVLGTLIAAAALSGALAVIGLIVALLGAARDRRVEADLIAQGVGPGRLRAELRLRLVLAGTIGVGAGVIIGLLLTRLAVAGVRAAGAVSSPRPALVTIAPTAALAVWALAAIAALALIGWAATLARPGSAR